jgi:hypothetical protein
MDGKADERMDGYTDWQMDGQAETSDNQTNNWAAIRTSGQKDRRTYQETDG